MLLWLVSTGPPQAALQVLENAGKFGVRPAFIVREQEDRRREGCQDQEMEETVDGDQPRHVTVA